MGIPKEDAESIDEDNDKSYRKVDQADSKSIDSSRSTEDEDEVTPVSLKFLNIL